MKIRFLVVGFASHQTWAEGYQRAASKNKIHSVHLEIISGDRWKFRMLIAAAELESKIAIDDDIVVVDGMLDASLLVALIKSNRPSNAPKIFVYLHENQLTTPFPSQDRDVKNQTHWHYGMAHLRSLMVADGFIFNSQTHKEAFAGALPTIINEQSPRDTVQWYLNRAHELLDTKCTVLNNGLELDELVSLVNSKKRTRTQDISVDRKIPCILWNARLEEDKNPGAFLDMLHQVKRRQKEQRIVAFRLIILGADSSKEKRWENRIRKEFAKELVHFGWCTNRKEYAQWLHKSDIIVSTANHETFGISIVESVFCGSLPLLPNRLSYPELFPPKQFQNMHLYTTTRGEGVDKLLKLMQLVAGDPVEHAKAQQLAKTAVSRYRWDIMSDIYDQFFVDVGAGEPIVLAGTKASSMLQDFLLLPSDADSSYPMTMDTDRSFISIDQPALHPQNKKIIIMEATDDRVALYRPKSLRNYIEYNRQITDLSSKQEVSLHGGRRASVRMLEAISMGAKIRPISFLTTRELAKSVLQEKIHHLQDTPIYIADNKELLDVIRGQKLNSGDALLVMVQFPIESNLQELIQHPPIVILDNVRNAENVGSILRTAFCLGITSVVASDTAWAALKDSRSARTSMGTIYYHRFYKASNLAKTIRDIQKSGGIQVYGIEIGPTAKPIHPHGRNNKWAFCMGNEDTGLNQEVANACDKISFIPQAHGDSLNVGHAAAITMFELGRECPVPRHDGRAACS
jgi:tRNA G18 (ribose-2'-O)-methylase SpoU/glycosyltransferase involved in cell wall biosynthesis